jgi:hypothetical protein
LLEDAEGAEAHRDAAALGRAAQQRLLAVGDRLADSSPILAQQFYRQAAAMWTAFGSAGFDRWVALGDTLALREPVCREGAMAFFSASPSQLGARGLEAAALWSRLGRDLADTSRRSS